MGVFLRKFTSPTNRSIVVRVVFSLVLFGGEMKSLGIESIVSLDN